MTTSQRERARRQRGECGRCGKPSASYYCPSCAEARAQRRSIQRPERPQQVYRGTKKPCALEGCDRTLSRDQVRRKGRYCSKTCAHSANYNLYESNQRNIRAINAAKRAWFLRNLKARLWADASAVLQPGTTIEAVVMRLYAAEKRGYHRGYGARIEHERRDKACLTRAS